MFLAFVLLVATSAVAMAQNAQTEKQIEVFGQRINYVEAGSGPVVILVHGLGGDWTNWAATIPALSTKYRVLAPDQIGFGKSAKPQINYRVGTLVDFLDEFCVKTGVTRATVVGNSLGGWTAAAFTLAHPEKVDRLVLVDAAGYGPARIGSPAPKREDLLRLNPSTIEDMKQLLGGILFSKQMLTDAFVRQAYSGRMAKNDGYTINMFIESILRGEDILDGKLGSIKTPTLVIWGREDFLTPLAWGKAFSEDIAGAELFVIDKCGHVPQTEAPQAFNKKLLEFLSGTKAATASTR